MTVLALVCLCAMAAGCAKPAGVIFEPMANPVVFPAPPEKGRIRYVGQLATSADLKPAVSFGQSLGEALFGKKEVKTMLTPYAVCTDGANRVFVADSNAQLVHVFDLETRVYQQWVPNNVEKRFAQPVGIAWDPSEHRLLVSDSVARSIFAFDTNGKYLGALAAGIFSRPCGFAIDPPRNRILVTDAILHEILVLSLDGKLIGAIGQRGTDLGQFNFPTNVAVDKEGRVFVSDSLNFRVQILDPALRPLGHIGSKGDMPGYFSQPKGLALDSFEHLYVVDANFEAVQIFNPQRALLMDFGQEGTGPGEFWLPTSIFIDGKNRIWIADSYNRRIEVFDLIPEGSQP